MSALLHRHILMPLDAVLSQLCTFVMLTAGFVLFHAKRETPAGISPLIHRQFPYVGIIQIRLWVGTNQFPLSRLQPAPLFSYAVIIARFSFVCKHIPVCMQKNTYLSLNSSISVALRQNN